MCQSRYRALSDRSGRALIVAARLSRLLKMSLALRAMQACSFDQYEPQTTWMMSTLWCRGRGVSTDELAVVGFSNSAFTPLSAE